MYEIAPSSVVKLYSIPLGHRSVPLFYAKNGHTPTEMRDLMFERHLVRSLTELSYVYKDGSIRCEGKESDYATINYISFTNPAFLGVVFYAKVINKAYINNNTIELMFAIDWWTTASTLSSTNYQPCPVERQHLTALQRRSALLNPYSATNRTLRTAEPFPATTPDNEVYYDVATTSDGTEGKNALALPLEDKASARSAFRFLFYPYDGDASEQDPFHEVIRYEDIDVNEPVLVLAVTQDVFQDLETVAEWNTLGGAGNGHFTPTSPVQNFKPWGSTGLYYIGVFPDKVVYPQMTYDEDGEVHYSMSTTVDGKTYVRDLIDALSVRYEVASLIVGIWMLPFYFVASWFEPFGDTARGLCPTLVQEIPRKSYDPDDASSENVEPKLDLFPFSYLRGETADGNRKEWKYEDFYASQAQTGRLYFRIITSLEPVPCAVLMPYSYKNNGNVDTQYNNRLKPFGEGLSYANFNQLGYTIDSYLTYLGESYRQVNLERSLPAGEKATGLIGGILGTVGEALGVASGASSGGNPIGGALTGGLGMIGKNLSNWMHTANVTNAGYHASGNDLTGDRGVLTDGRAAYAVAARNRAAITEDPSIAVDDSLGSSSQRLSFATDQYVGGNMSGNLARVTRTPDFMLYYVEPNASAKEAFKKWLFYYGYADGGIGVPNVCQYAKGTADPWLPAVDGEKGCYCKTNGARVVTEFGSVADHAIESMLDSGIRFVDAYEV